MVLDTHLKMNLITKIFKKSKKEEPKKNKKPLNPFELPTTDLQELYSCSVQKTVKDFVTYDIGTKKAPVRVAMDSCDNFNLDTLQNAYTMNQAGQEIIYSYFAKQGFIGFNNCAILAQDWLINKAISAPCEDAIAINYDITLQDNEITDEDHDIITKLKEKDYKYNIKKVCENFAQNKRKYGQALCIPLVKDANYTNPFNIDSIASNSYRGMVSIEPQWIAAELDIEAITDPLSPRYYQPTYFKMPNGQRVHYSWFIFNTYGTVADILKPTYYWGGVPLPQLLYEQTYAAHKTAKEAPMLAQSKRLNYIESNPTALLQDKNRLNNTLGLMSWLRNNWGWLLIKKDQRLGQIDTTLTDFDAVTMLSYQVVAAIAGMPAARLLETSPKGWQSSGSYEDDNYRKLQQNIQRLDFCPILNMHYKLLAKSMFDIDKNYCVNFDDIDTPTEKERAEIREINARTDSTYIEAGVLSPDEVRTVIKEDINSGYNAIEENPEPEDLDFEIENEEKSINI